MNWIMNPAVFMHCKNDSVLDAFGYRTDYFFTNNFKEKKIF